MKVDPNDSRFDWQRPDFDKPKGLADVPDGKVVKIESSAAPLSDETFKRSFCRSRRNGLNYSTRLPCTLVGASGGRKRKDLR